MKKGTNNIEYISYLSVISTIAVVILHTNVIFWTFSKDGIWISANVIESIFYFAVPIFFMITGITLLNYRDRYDTKTFFKKRIIKTVIPFITWSLIGLVYSLIIKAVDINNLSLTKIVYGIFSASILTIYWFFIPLFQMYLCIPFLSNIKEENRNRIYIICIILSFILICTLTMIFNHNLVDSPLSYKMLPLYIIYVLLGYLLNKHKISKKEEYIIYILGFISLLIHIIGTQYLSLKEGYIVKTFKGYCNIPCILYSTAIFTFIKNRLYLIKNKYTAIIVNILKKYTFSIYLIHWFVMDILVRLFNLDITSLLFRLGLPFLLIPLCVVIIYLLRKIPLIKKIVP